MADASLRLLTDHDRDEVLGSATVTRSRTFSSASRIRAAGMEPARLGGQMWGYADGRPLTSLCYSGANLVPVAANSAAVAAYAASGPAAGPPVLLDRRARLTP